MMFDESTAVVNRKAANARTGLGDWTMTLPIIPNQLMPWIYFGENTVYLKPGAPEEIKPLYEKLKVTMKRLDEESLPKL